MNPLPNLNNLINTFAFYDESHFLSIFYFQFFMMVFFFISTSGNILVLYNFHSFNSSRPKFILLVGWFCSPGLVFDTTALNCNCRSCLSFMIDSTSLSQPHISWQTCSFSQLRANQVWATVSMMEGHSQRSTSS